MTSIMTVMAYSREAVDRSDDSSSAPMLSIPRRKPAGPLRRQMIAAGAAVVWLAAFVQAVFDFIRKNARF